MTIKTRLSRLEKRIPAPAPDVLTPAEWLADRIEHPGKTSEEVWRIQNPGRTPTPAQVAWWAEQSRRVASMRATWAMFADDGAQSATQ